jgi:hypothetical protein
VISAWNVFYGYEIFRILMLLGRFKEGCKNGGIYNGLKITEDEPLRLSKAGKKS